MGKFAEWIEYKGKKILFINQKDLLEDDVILSLNEGMDEIDHCPDDLILVLTDVTNIFTTEKIKQKSKELAELSKGKNIKSAVVGITGVKKIIASAIIKDIYFSKSLEDAKDWLINQK